MIGLNVHERMFKKLKVVIVLGSLAARAQQLLLILLFDTHKIRGNDQLIPKKPRKKTFYY